MMIKKKGHSKKNEKPSVGRYAWDNPIEFLLSCTSISVGLGNIWRFPYLCYRNGGGAFLILYLGMLLTLGLPLLFLEMTVGQYAGVGPHLIFARLAPIFQGLGFAILTMMLFITIYFHMIIAWALFYLFSSFNKIFGWSSCDNTFNSPKCFSEMENYACQLFESNSKPFAFYQGECHSVEDLCLKFGPKYLISDPRHCINPEKNHTHHLKEILSYVESSLEYYNDIAMGIEGASWTNLRWGLLGCLFLAWILAALCLIDGIRSSGKVAYFTGTFPYFILISLFIRGSTLEGGLDGIYYYFTPKWERLLTPQIWGDAATQLFYALGIGCGSVISLSSYNKFHNNCFRDAVLVSLSNVLSSLLAGMALFAILGFLSHDMGIPFEEILDSGTSLSFVAFPEAVLRMPMPQLWAVLFFFMLGILGLGGQLAGIETLLTAFADQWPALRECRTLLAQVTCASCFILSVPLCFNGGIHLFTLFEWNSTSWALLILAFLEITLVTWLYGCGRFIDNLREMRIEFNKFEHFYWWISLSILTPSIIVGVLIFSIVNRQPTVTSLPQWVHLFGWFIGFISLLPLPAFAVYQMSLAGQVDKKLVKPSSSWVPAEKKIPSQVYDNTAYNGSEI